MSDEKINLNLWDSVCQTDPSYTKKVSVGKRSYTDIAPMWLVMKATELWGPYGSTWGLKDIELAMPEDAAQNLAVIKAVFWYPHGEFPIINALKIADSRGPDPDFAKKLQTNTLSKALSYVGFGADVFLGWFDDADYVDQVAERYQAEGKVDQASLDLMWQLVKDTSTDVAKIAKAYGVDTIEVLTAEQVEKVIKQLSAKLRKQDVPQ